MVTFTQFGSCVSRDVFNFTRDLDYVVSHTHNGINISTLLMDNHLSIDDRYIFAENGFWKRMQQFIFKHDVFDEYIKQLNTEYFIFDLAGERLPLQLWKDESGEAKVPVNWQTYNTSLNLKKDSRMMVSISDWHLADRNKALYKTDLVNFCKLIKEKYGENKIIYLSVKQADSFLNKYNNELCSFDDYEGNGIERKSLRVKQNEVIDFAEKIILNELPKIWIVNFPTNTVADDRHHFGRHTLHFNHFLYEYFSDAVELIVRSNLRQNIDDAQVKKRLDFMKTYAEIRMDEVIRVFKNN